MAEYTLEVAQDGSYYLVDQNNDEIADNIHRYFFGVTKANSKISDNDLVIKLKNTEKLKLSSKDIILVDALRKCVLSVYLPTVTIDFWSGDEYKFSGNKSEYEQPTYIWYDKASNTSGLVVPDKGTEFAPISLYAWNNSGGTRTLVKNFTSADMEEEFPEEFNVEMDEPADTDSTEIENGQLRLRIFTKDSKTAMKIKNKIQSLSPNEFELKTLFNYDKPCNEWRMRFETIGEIKTAVQVLEDYCKSKANILRYEIYTTLKTGSD